jgi:hypothetical protein
MGYIGAGISRFNTADELTVTGDAEFNGNANFGDSDKVSFSSGKLEMYHDGTNAYIDETFANGTFLIRGNNISLQKYTGETMIQCVSDGKVELNFNNVPKLETTSSGVDVTGTVTATTFQANAGGTFTTASGNDLNIVYPDSRSLFIKEGSTTHVTVNNVGNVGIGNASPDFNLSVGNSSSVNPSIQIMSATNSNAQLLFGDGAGAAGYRGTVVYGNATDSMSFSTAGGERMRLDSSGNLLVGGTEVNPQNQSSGSGSALRADGRGFFRATSATVLGANLQGNDGQVIRISKAGSELGGMYAFSNEIALVSGNTGLYFDDANNKIFPLNGSGGVRDNITDLGASNARFKDGYFSNGITARYHYNIDDPDTYFDFATGNNIKVFNGGSEKFRFSSDGAFMLGQTVTSAPGNGNTATGIVLRGALGDAFFSRSNSEAAFFNRNTDGRCIKFSRSGVAVGNVSVTTSGSTYNTTSDIRLKQDIEPLKATDKLMAMNPVSYSWKADPDGPRSMGFIAQEMADVMPEAVSTGDDDMMSMDYGRITPILVSALQDAHRKIEELAAEIAELKAN